MLMFLSYALALSTYAALCDKLFRLARLKYAGRGLLPRRPKGRHSRSIFCYCDPAGSKHIRKRPPLNKAAFRARVQSICKTKHAQAVAKKFAQVLRKVSEEVVAKQGAASRM